MPEVEKIEFEFYCEVCGMRGGPGSVVEVDAELVKHVREVHGFQLEPLVAREGREPRLRWVRSDKENGDL